MFGKILKKDLKRKKAMNIILFLFMIIASMLIAGSVNLLYTTTTALEHFKLISKTSDNIIITFSDPENDKMMEEWSSGCSKIKDINSEEMLSVTVDKITLPSQYKKLEEASTLAIARVPEKSNLVFTQEDKKLELNPGEAAIPNTIRNKTGLKLGDRIKIKLGDVEKELVVKHFLKDVLFGSGMMGFKRIMVSDEDYEAYNRASEKTNLKLWEISKTETATYQEIEKDFSKTTITSIFYVDNDAVSFTYLMDLMTAAIMSIVSIFLIFISFLILRFTIRFTIEEDYKEIGIMKAIGLKNAGIKKIYLVKYSALAMLGGCIGFLGSIPFSGYLRSNISQNIMMTTTVLNYFLSALSSIAVILITILFCYLCTGRINKMTAIDAIRQGSIGERFSASRKLKLHNMKYISSPVYMAVNDLLSGFKKFIILMVTFILGTIIIIVPINNINTLASDDILALFGQGDSDFTITPESLGVNYREFSIDELLKNVEKVQSEMNDKEINVNLHPEIMFMIKAYSDNPDDSKNILSMQGYGYSTENYIYLKGIPPKLENEIAITEKTAEYFGIGLGDTVYCTDKEGTDKFIVTALFQSMSDLGFSMRFSEKHMINLEDSAGLSFFGSFSNKENESEQLEKLKKEFPELGIKSSREYVEGFMGDATSQLNNLKNIILIVVLGINCLITSLLVKMHISKEIPEIAVLKSLGFKNRGIRKWQAVRIMLVLLVSIILGTLLANLTGGYMTSGIFSFMGATQVDLRIEPLQVYLIYPVIILTVTMLSALVSLGQVKRTNIWELNNQE